MKFCSYFSYSDKGLFLIKYGSTDKFLLKINKIINKVATLNKISKKNYLSVVLFKIYKKYEMNQYIFEIFMEEIIYLLTSMFKENSINNYYKIQLLSPLYCDYYLNIMTNIFDNDYFVGIIFDSFISKIIIHPNRLINLFLCNLLHRKFYIDIDKYDYYYDTNAYNTNFYLALDKKKNIIFLIYICFIIIAQIVYMKLNHIDITQLYVIYGFMHVYLIYYIYIYNILYI